MITAARFQDLCTSSSAALERCSLPSPTPPSHNCFLRTHNCDARQAAIHEAIKEEFFKAADVEATLVSSRTGKAAGHPLRVQLT